MENKSQPPLGPLRSKTRMVQTRLSHPIRYELEFGPNDSGHQYRHCRQLIIVGLPMKGSVFSSGVAVLLAVGCDCMLVT